MSTTHQKGTGVRLDSNSEFTFRGLTIQVTGQKLAVLASLIIVS